MKQQIWCGKNMVGIGGFDMMEKKNILVISAHAVDFIWRCGGTIAQYAKNGNNVKVIDITFGSRGESDQVWRENPGIREQEVRSRRKEEASRAAEILGTQIEFYDYDDHLLVYDKEMIMKLAGEFKDFQPDYILTHTQDPMNPDHTNTKEAVLAALRSAQVYGVFPEKKVITDTNIFMYEPDQPEFCGFRPDFYIDITDVMDLKIKAMQIVASQQHLLHNYTNRAEYRSYLAKRLACNPQIKYAEAFQRYAPGVGKEFR